MALLDTMGPLAASRREPPTFTALHAAAQSNSVACLQLLLARRAHATATEPGAGMTPLHYAAMAEGHEGLRLLLALAPVTVRDARQQSLLHAAARSGAVACLKHLLEQVGA